MSLETIINFLLSSYALFALPIAVASSIAVLLLPIFYILAGITVFGLWFGIFFLCGPSNPLSETLNLLTGGVRRRKDELLNLAVQLSARLPQ